MPSVWTYACRVNFFDTGSWRNLIINNENRNKADTKRILNNAKKVLPVENQHC